MGKIKNVVIVNDFDYVQGGATKVALDTAQILYNNNVNVIYFSAVHQDNNYKFKQISTNQKECLRDGIKGALRGLYNFKAAREFGKLLDTLDKNDTVIHVHGWTKALSSSIFRIAYKKKFKLVLTLHDYFTVCPNGGLFNYKKCEICRKKAMSFDCIKTNCDSRNYLFKLYRIVRQYIQKHNMKNLKNVISISDFSEKIIKDKVNKNIKFYRINNPIEFTNEKVKGNYIENNYYLFLGRISKEKGIDLFCQALTELNLPGVVVGDGDEKERLQKKYKNIEFVGWKEKEEVQKYIIDSRALVLPSRWYEGAPLTPLEAMQYRIPCIVSNCSAACEYIIEGRNGFVFDLDNLTNVIRKYEENISSFKNDVYFEKVINEYKTDKYINSLINLYNKIIK